MLVPFLIMLREGIEAALIVGIVAGYLIKTGRRAWLPAVWAGAGLAALLCLALGIAIDAVSGEFPQKQQELIEGVIGLIAVAILGSMVIWMKRAAHSIKSELHHSVDAALSTERGQGWALVGIAFLAVGREGLESVFFLLAAFRQDVGALAPAGAVLGLVAAVALVAALTWSGARLDLSRFFFWTGLFILFVAAGLLAGAVRAFHEAGLWNGLQETAFDASAILPVDGIAGTLLAALFGYTDAPAMGEVLAWAAFLIPALALFLGRRPPVVRAA